MPLSKEEILDSRGIRHLEVLKFFDLKQFAINETVYHNLEFHSIKVKCQEKREEFTKQLKKSGASKWAGRVALGF